MNKVFKVIWNHATQSWVAVSELTSAKGKTKSKKLTALSVAVGSALVGTPALAAVYVNNQEVTTAGSGSRIFITTATHPAMSSLLDQNNPKYDYSIRIGDEGQPSTRGGDILIGYGHRNLSTGEAGDTIIGHRANIGGGNFDSFSTGVGYRVQSAGPSVSIGVGARSDIRSSSGWNGTRNGGVAIGAYALQGGNKDGGVAVGALSGGDYNYITSIGALSGVGGYQVDQVKNVGYRVNGGNDGATSIGYSAGARGQNSVAVGREATTANFKGKDAVSVGYSTHSIGESSVALGSYAVAGGFSESEITQLQTEKTRLEGVLTCITTAWEGAKDELNAATSQTPVPSTAELKFRMGQLLSAREKAQQELNRINADLNRTSATPTQSTVTAMAIGYKAKANNQNATAIGRESQASAISAVALGTNARVNANLATSAVAIGQDANVLQNSSHAIAIGANASVVGDLNGSSGSIAIGHNTAAGNKNASWSKNASRELGYLAAQNATAVGSESVAGGTNSTAFGYKNVINAPNSGALGFNNIIGNHTKEEYNNNVASAEYNGTDSFVVGANNNVTANNTVVFGNNVTVNSQGINRTGAVVFGDNSTVPTEVKAVNSAKIGTTDGSKLVYSGFAGNLHGTDTDGNPSKAAADKQGRFVSVGNATSPRQVKFVAAGEISATSTDAINGSQLYAFSGVVNNLATSASTIIGGGATLNQNGTLENFSQPLNTTGLAGAAYTKPTTAANNIATAITNLNDYVNAGWKIAQGDDTAAKARISPNEQVNFKANGLATVSVEANGTGGADVTYSVQKGTFDTTTNGTVKANPTEGVVTNTDVATAVNNSGWNTTTTGGTNVTVNPGDQVNYVNGKGTNANVTTAKDANGKDVVSVSYNVNETTGTVNPNGTVKVSDNNAFLNASAVANLVNNAGFNVTTKAVDKFAEQTTKTARVKAGGNVTYIAGKNIAIEQDNQNFTFSTTKDVVFNNAQVNSTLTIGNGTATSPKVNIQSTTKGLDMGNAVLTNVSSGITPYAAGTTPVTTAKSGLADLANSTQTNVVTVADAAKLGWVVSTDKTTTDATTGTADGNVYAANVTTANEVKFVGKGYATVSGATDSNGVRTITVSVGNVGAGKINADGSVTETKAGLLTAEEGTKLINGAGWLTNVTNATTGLTETKVVTPGTQVNYVDGNGTTANVIKNTVGGKEVVSVSYDVKAGANTIAFNKDGDELVKVGDKYYKVADVVDGKPTNNAVAVETADIATADNRTPYENALNGLVNLTSSVQSNAMTVADAARMGWVVSTSANDYSANVTNTKEVNFVGLGAVDVSGSNVDEIRNINVSVDLPVDYTETTITENGQEVDVVKLSDGKWYKVSDLNDQGEPKDDAVAVDTKVTPISKKGAVLSDASSSLNNNPYKAKEYTYDDVNQTVTPKTYAELLAADPNFNKDEIKEGTNGVKLNNVGWAEAPDQAVNLDQLNQTVYKSGFYVKQNGVDTKGTNSAEDSATEKVTPEDVVNFVNGKNTVLKATTTRNAQTGQDTTNVTVDVDLPVVYTDAEGAKVVKVGDKYYYAEDVENGKLKNGVDADNDAVTNVVASMNNVASDDDTAGNNVVLRNVAEGTKTLAFDTEGNPLVEIDGKYYKLNEDGKADTTTVITPATSEQLKQLDDKYLANFTSAVTGLADLDHSDQSNALTVADAQKLGWVVSAGDYAANVTNANEVRFNGSNGISVTGETDKNTGVRNINVSIAKGKVDGNTTTGVATGDTNYVTGDQVAKAINESGWKTNVTNATTGLPETKVVTPGTQVDYVNGNGTTANVTLKDGKVAVSYNVNQTTGSVNPNGTATVTDGNAFLNASTVANLVNNSAFNVTTAKVDAFAENQEGKANAAVKAGGNITYTAGKNIAISQNGSNFTFSTTKDIEVDSVTANKRVQIGSGDTAVNLTTDLGALQVADKDGNATQITNVEAGTNVMAFNKEGDQLVQVGDKFYVVDPETNEVDFTKESTPATEEELDELAKAKPALKAYVAYSKAASGLADLDNSEQTNALTVADAQRLGWVVSASGNDYADSVTNANEVRFNGSNGISVTGETDEHGVRNINVSIAKGNVEGNTTTGVAAGDTNYVTGDQVAKAINESGWKTNVTNATTGLPETKVVTPGTQVDYVNGNGTTANVTLKDGKVAVSYNVNQTTGSVNPNGTATVTDGNAFLNASTVANLVNNSAFNVTTAKVDAFAENQEGKANAAVKAGGNITYTAGKNIAISQNGSNFTFSTTKDIEVDSVTANKRVQIGSGDTAVNLTTDLGALQVADKDGNATQITNVEAGTNVMAFNKEGDQLVQVGDKFYVVDPETNEVDFTKESTPATEEELDELAKAKPALKAYVAYSKAASGLADLDNSEQTNALTVADAQRLGWVVSASGNDYADSVTNANEVRFNGSNGISVTGETDEHGVRNINVSIAKGNVEGNTTTGVAAGDTNYVTGDQVAKAINESGWKTNVTNATTGLPETKVVTPGTQVDYVNGNGTTANVTLKDGKVAVSYNVNQTTGSVNPNGTATVTDGNAFLNASTVANLVNNSAFNVTTAKVDAFAENQEGKANAAVKAGGNITYTAGKNIAISQNGSNFTFSTTKDIEVDSVTANKRVQIGSGDTAVNLTTDLGALQVADKDGNATQITNVEAGTNVMAFNKEGDQLVQVGDKFYVVDPETNEVDFTKESTPATEEELDELAKAKPALKAYVAYSKAASGLADLDNSEQTNALTVADAQRLGWVVSASGNDYADSVTNANEVRFNGSNGISVTGETDEHGVRNINVSIAKGNVAGNTTTGVATGDTNYVTGDQVAKAINESGWKTNVTNATTGLPETKVVTPGTQVDYVNGNGTTANVTLKDGKVAVSYNVNQTTGSVNPNGTATVTDGNAFLNASTVANLVNNSAFNVTTAKVDAFAENQEGKANAAVKAGGNITYTAGKNIAISQNGSNFTFSTTKDIEVDSVTANKRVQIGSGDTAVNLTTDLGALQVADKDGNATQITNVEAGTNVMAFNKEGDQLVQVGDKFYVVDPETNEVDFTKESTPATEEELDELAKAKPALKAYVAYSKAASGLADLDNSEQTNALTVADAQRLGWVVSASGNDYADSVTNANEVRFNGSNGISVTGETDEHGVRNINVSIAKGNVAGNTTTGVATGDTNYVTGDQVANAINNSGWKTTATKVVDEAGNEIVDANKATAVNPGDSVNYVDGNSTKANVVVTKAADGKETVNVSYDLVTEDHLTPVANDAKSVTKPTNIDAKGKDAATVNDVLNAGWNLQANDEAVDAVTHGNNVNFTSKDGSVKITAKSDGSTSSLDFAVNATSIVNQVAGTISYNKDGKATTNGDGKRIATVGDVANTINNTGWLTNVTDAKGNVTTKVVTPNTQVNYVNGDGTKANVVANSTTGGLDVTFNVKSANPETLTVDGNGVKVNTGSITEATDVAGDANRGKVTVAAGEGNKVATVQNVANAINSASWTVKVADTQEEITTSTANDEGSSVRAGNEITHVAGKNLKVKRDGRNVTYALANDVSVNTVTAQNSIKVGAGNAATTVTTSSAQDGVTEVKLADAAGKATRITNVAAGVKDTDAVNVSQLRNSNAQINQNIAHLNNKVNRMGKDLRAGIAGSNAAAGLPQVYIPGKSMVAAAAGTFKGQSAVAVGYSRASDNGKVILKLQGNANTRGDVGGSVGVGYQW